MFRRSRRQKRLYFKSGRVVACLSDDPADYYGQHLLLNGHLNEVQLVDALSYCTRSGKRLGLALTELDLLSREQVQASLSRQISDSVCGLFLWNHGVFYYEEDLPPEEEILPEPIDPMSLVMEGTRWIDEYARFRKVFPHDNVVLRQGPAWPGRKLSPVQERIRDLVDGQKTLAKIHWRLKGSSFRVLEGAFQMCLNEILDLGAVGEAMDNTSLEINVYDLLLEQAVEEETRSHSTAPTLPLALLGGMRPVWVRQPTARDVSKLPEELQLLIARFDGSLPMEQLVPESRKTAAGWDFFVEHLRKGNLALIPASPDELEVELSSSPSFWRRLFGR